ncbi:hypothetical protein CEB3_c10030 [Peptococcaceae bacterium CEB3]|nr:hypothetical protein CEB3_c10030 [Peptococcaceae bacterium CEB3]
MNAAAKVCFVIMGFGKKQDYGSNRTLDLDQTYKNIIKPAVEQSSLRCIRADEIMDSGIIDKSMYALIMKADLVIADISTYNPNVLYELGVRHAVRPFSTIILKEKGCDFPFDLNHNRIFTYTHLGEDIGADEANRCQTELRLLINEIILAQNVDSPLYEYLKKTTPPSLNEDEYTQVLDELAEKENTVFAFVEKAKEFMKNSSLEKNLFEEAAAMWSKVEQLVPTEKYFTQQRALCTYKSKQPSIHSALCDALVIIDRLNPRDSHDTETLGIAGAICRRLFEESEDAVYLDRAIEHYGRGYNLNNDYYTGENYAFCLDLRRNSVEDSEEKIYLKLRAKKARQKIIGFLEIVTRDSDFEKREDKEWVFASISTCYYALNDDVKGHYYEDKFKNEFTSPWEEETFNDSKGKILSLRDS